MNKMNKKSEKYPDPMTLTELLALEFCVVPWCENVREDDDPLYCPYHRREQSRFEADMLSIEEPGQNWATLKQRYLIFQRDNFRCQICGSAVVDGPHVKLELDHITPVSKGGSDDEDNLWTLCFKCNRGKGNRTL